MSEYPIAGGDNYANAEAQDEFEREQNRKYEQWKSQQETIESEAKPESTGKAPDATPETKDKGLIYNVGHTAAAVPLLPHSATSCFGRQCGGSAARRR